MALKSELPACLHLSSVFLPGEPDRTVWASWSRELLSARPKSTGSARTEPRAGLRSETDPERVSVPRSLSAGEEEEGFLLQGQEALQKAGLQQEGIAVRLKICRLHFFSCVRPIGESFSFSDFCHNDADLPALSSVGLFLLFKKKQIIAILVQIGKWVWTH